MKIDYAKLISAAGSNKQAEETFGPHALDSGYLNRSTGEIEFVPEVEGGFDGYEGIVGKEAAIDSVFVRAEIEANPQNWLEIPRCESGADVEKFAYAWLSNCNLPDYTVD